PGPGLLFGSDLDRPLVVPVRFLEALDLLEQIDHVAECGPLPLDRPAAAGGTVLRVPLAAVDLPGDGGVFADPRDVDVPLAFLRDLAGVEQFEIAPLVVLENRFEQFPGPGSHDRGAWGVSPLWRAWGV